MVKFFLNGKEVESHSDPLTRLLDVFRKEFGLTGPKEGCGEGECGACSCLVDGNLTNSCLAALGSIAGKQVITLEGFRDSPQYKLLESTFAEAGAVQCGFCTPGMIMAAQALLLKVPDPSEDDIRNAISGNLCRCTGYNMIINGVKLAAQRGNGLW